MGWSFKVPTSFQINKYSLRFYFFSLFFKEGLLISFLLFRNLERYVAYLEWVRSIDDWTKLKFLDESHFVSRELTTSRVWGFQSSRVYTVDNSLHDPSLSVTIITNLLGEEPVFFDLRESSNNQWDFLELLIYACTHGFLSNGDYLICDNAAVHHGDDTADLVEELLTLHGILVYLKLLYHSISQYLILT
jgi:hypothetical protein